MKQLWCLIGAQFDGFKLKWLLVRLMFDKNSCSIGPFPIFVSGSRQIIRNDSGNDGNIYENVIKENNITTIHTTNDYHNADL